MEDDLRHPSPAPIDFNVIVYLVFCGTFGTFGTFWWCVIMLVVRRVRQWYTSLFYVSLSTFNYGSVFVLMHDRVGYRRKSKHSRIVSNQNTQSTKHPNALLLGSFSKLLMKIEMEIIFEFHFETSFYV